MRHPDTRWRPADWIALILAVTVLMTLTMLGVTRMMDLPPPSEHMVSAWKDVLLVLIGALARSIGDSSGGIGAKDHKPDASKEI